MKILLYLITILLKVSNNSNNLCFLTLIIFFVYFVSFLPYLFTFNCFGKRAGLKKEEVQ